MKIDLNDLFPEAEDGTRSPLPKQSEFLRDVLNPNGPQFISYFGGYGSGKSVVLCAAVIASAVVYGGEWVIARHHMPELRRTTMKAFLDMLPKELVLEIRVADAEVHIRSAVGKAIIYFVGVDEPQKLDSLNLSGFAIDEAAQTSEEAFLKLQGRLRNKKGLRKGLLVGNPKGRDHVYRYFVSKLAVKPESRHAYKMIVAPSTENKHLPADYVSQLLSTYSKERIQRDIMGSFDSFEGMIYSDFERAKHVVEPFDVPESWTRIIGLDVGFTNPAAAMFGAVDEDGNVWIYDEFYKREWLIQDICKLGLIPKIGKSKVSAIYIDPSSKAKRNQANGRAYSDFSTYMENLGDKIPLLPANNEVGTGLDRVKSYMRVNPVTKVPKLRIFSTCTNLIEEIGEYRWAELNASQEGTKNQKEEPRKYNDHACDALRYLIMSRPDPAAKDKTEAFKTGWPTLSKRIQAELHDLKNPKKKDPFQDF